jgi:hypothetical protein
MTPWATSTASVPNRGAYTQLPKPTLTPSMLAYMRARNKAAAVRAIQPAVTNSRPLLQLEDSPIVKKLCIPSPHATEPFIKLPKLPVSVKQTASQTALNFPNRRIDDENVPDYDEGEEPSDGETLDSEEDRSADEEPCAHDNVFIDDE